MLGQDRYAYITEDGRVDHTTRGIGGSVDSLPMSQGTPFANVLFRAMRIV
jgi:hypothetical protein